MQAVTSELSTIPHVQELDNKSEEARSGRFTLIDNSEINYLMLL
jgi:hypothetical protein